MGRCKKTGPRVAAALIVAIGVATVWAVALLWGGYFVTQFGRTGYVYEDIDILRDGTPVISTRSNINWSDITHRTLDGKPIEVNAQKGQLVPATFGAPSKPPGLYENALHWPARLAALVDYGRPQASWYFVRDAEPLGQGYFVGYDERSKLCVGYISRVGFGQSLPAREQWFDIGRHRLDYASGAITTAGAISYGSSVNSYASSVETRRMPPWLAYVIDGNRVVEVDLRARTLRTLYESVGLQATALLYEERARARMPATADQLKLAQGEVDIIPRVDGDASPRTTSVPNLAVRTTDRIVVIDPPDGKKREIILPEALRDQGFSAYALPNGELLAISRADDDVRLNRLTWIRADGTVAREQEVRLASPGEVSEHVATWMTVPIAPIPAGWGTVLGAVAPLSMLQSCKATTYSDAIAQIMKFAGLPLLAVVVIGALLAWWTLRLQRKYRRPSSRVWATFVFLLGLPGLLAYLLEQRRAKLEPCTQCGEIVPRDREVCAACDKEFVVPARIGTEILA